MLSVMTMIVILARWHNAKCLYTENHYVECHFAATLLWVHADCHYVKCHDTELHYTKCHFILSLCRLSLCRVSLHWVSLCQVSVCRPIMLIAIMLCFIMLRQISTCHFAECRSAINHDWTISKNMLRWKMVMQGESVVFLWWRRWEKAPSGLYYKTLCTAIKLKGL